MAATPKYKAQDLYSFLQQNNWTDEVKKFVNKEDKTTIDYKYLKHPQKELYCVLWKNKLMFGTGVIVTKHIISLVSKHILLRCGTKVTVDTSTRLILIGEHQSIAINF